MERSFTNPSTFSIGYYPFRGKAQLPRLIAQYLHISFQDTFFDPENWSNFKTKGNQKQAIKDLPFLRHQDFIVSGVQSMLVYLSQSAGRKDLLGQSLEHKSQVDMFLSKDYLGRLLSFVCTARMMVSRSFSEKKQLIENQYEKRVVPMLSQLEKDCSPQGFYLTGLAIIDFAIYEIVNILKAVLPDYVDKFIRLCWIQEQIASLPQISDYENSHRAIKGFCPVSYFKKFKRERRKLRQQRELNESTDQGQYCELQKMSM